MTFSIHFAWFFFAMLGIHSNDLFALDKVETQGKAVTRSHSEFGFQLSESALGTLKIQFHKLNHQMPFQLDRKAIIQFQDKVGIFRFREGWFKLIEVEINPVLDTKQSQFGSFILVKSKGLREGDQVVISGGPLLRVAELQIAGAGE